MIILYDKKEKTLVIKSSNDAVNFLYYQQGTIPTEQHIKNYIKNPKNKGDKIYDFFIKEGKINLKKINKIKHELAKCDSVIPLYDVYQANLFLIDKMNVYNRVTYNHFRFPDQFFLEKQIRKLDAIDKLYKDNQN